MHVRQTQRRVKSGEARSLVCVTQGAAPRGVRALESLVVSGHRAQQQQEPAAAARTSSRRRRSSSRNQQQQKT
ncbi:unnamed protein product [Lampetra fluviatilis]